MCGFKDNSEALVTFSNLRSPIFATWCVCAIQPNGFTIFSIDPAVLSILHITLTTLTFCYKYKALSEFCH